MKLSTKIIATLAPVFIIAVVVSIYLDYILQEQQLLDQAQEAASTQAEIIKSSLVNMMTTNLKVDDSYLEQISKSGNIEHLSVLFYVDSLHLRQEYDDSSRYQRLKARQANVMEGKPDFIHEAFTTHQQQLYITCGLHKHPVTEINTNSSKPFWLPECERLSVVLPFKAEEKCQKCHAVPTDYILGAAYMDISLAKTSAMLRTNAMSSIGVFLLFSVVALVLGYTIYRRFISKPVYQLVEVTEVLGSGNLTKPIGEEFEEDEFGRLADSFDRMRQRLQEAQQSLIHQERLSTLGQMASSIIHDFRSPMTAISLSLDLLRLNANLPPEKQREIHATIREMLDRMNTMTQELLEFSRGKINLDVQEWNVREFVRIISSSVELQLKAQKITFREECKYSENAKFDKDRLTRAFINIINNAQDAMPGGGVITFLAFMQEGNVTFQIIDTGKGIPTEIRDKIFDPFVTSGKKKGTGLGLAITKKVIEEHGGTISFQSELGKGTTFVVTIPA